MTLATQIVSDNSIFFNNDDFAVAAKYSSKDGSIVSASISVILDLEVDLGGTDYGMAEMASVWLKASDVPNPAIYDEITIGGTVYIVRTRARGAGGVLQVMVESDRRQNPVNV